MGSTLGNFMGMDLHPHLVTGMGQPAETAQEPVSPSNAAGEALAAHAQEAVPSKTMSFFQSAGHVNFTL